jgi:hypothetical protein
MSQEHDFRYSHIIMTQTGAGANTQSDYVAVCRHCGIVRRGPAQTPPPDTELVATYAQALDDAQAVIERMFAQHGSRAIFAETGLPTTIGPYAKLDVGEQECEIVNKRYLADLEIIAKHWCSGIDYIDEPHHSAAKRLRDVWGEMPSHDVRHDVR